MFDDDYPDYYLGDDDEAPRRSRPIDCAAHTFAPKLLIVKMRRMMRSFTTRLSATITALRAQGANAAAVASTSSDC